MTMRCGVLTSSFLPILLAAASAARAETYTLTVAAPGAVTPSSAFHLGTATSPNGPAIRVDGESVLFGDERVVPVMGEMHYSRVNPGDWREALLKMKAGGITVVSTYVFWNHHEEVEGKWDWTGERDLRSFLERCKEVGLPVIVRMGPWCHGEVRNGGIPDWLIEKKVKLRSEDPAFLDEVRILYGEIAKQMAGLLYKDGGPVIGVQVDNEYRGKASYLLALKKMAMGVGVDVPLYTRTGWPKLSTPMPFGEILPMYGAYAEGFWDRELTSMPGSYWQAFTFGAERTDTAVGTDVLGKRSREDEANAERYPYLTCELGGGMETSYHRRIHIDPRDAYALEIAKVGSGSNLPGFYMYHGGTNPDAVTGRGAGGAGIYLNEHQGTATTNYNDMPCKSYDFLAPIGQYGQIREPYHLLRRTNMFLHDWQAVLAPMTANFPGVKITKTDSGDLRWAVRSDGKSGFVFVNNYQRGLEMPAKEGVQLVLGFRWDSMLTIPDVTVPANSAFFMPFHMPVEGSDLLYALAQPVCKVEEGKQTVIVFSEIPGVRPEFAFVSEEGVEKKAGAGGIAETMYRVSGKDHTTEIFVVNAARSQQVWRAKVGGKERILITSPGETLYSDGKTVTLQTTDPGLSKFDLVSIPPLEGVSLPKDAGLSPLPPVSIQQTREAGKPREIKMGVNKAGGGAATEPVDADFAGAQPAVYRIELPKDVDVQRRLLLRIHYVGDVARLYLGDKMLTDNFYNGTPFDLDLTQLGAEVYQRGLTLKILPLQKGAPIYIQKEDMPDFGGTESVAAVKSAELVETRQVVLRP
ncbi:MAG TPA: beta-galactosidase [Phycisphaerae bacterium]|nr:beta-galactosidase [Phycisphaerae bacterium]